MISRRTRIGVKALGFALRVLILTLFTGTAVYAADGDILETTVPEPKPATSHQSAAAASLNKPGNAGTSPIPTPSSTHTELTVGIAAARALVVDEAGRLLEVWSNADESQWDAAVNQGEETLVARLGAIDGPLLEVIPAGALEEYTGLLETADWTARGMVWVR